MSSKHIAGEQPSSSAQKRKPSKRPLVRSDDEDDEDGSVPSIGQKMKRARTVDTDASLSATSTQDDDNDMDVDVETFRDSAQRSLSGLDDGRFHSEDTEAQGPLSSHKARGDAYKNRKRSSVVSVSTKKMAQTAYSEDEGSEGYGERDSVEDDLSDMAPPLSEHDDDDFDHDTLPRRVMKAKTRGSKGKGVKVKSGQLKGAKAKGLKDKDKDKERDKDIHMKDERNPVPPPASTPRASSATAQNQPLDLFSTDEHAPSSAVDPPLDSTQSAKKVLSQAIPKKRLPTIKKNKVVGGATGALTSSTTTQKPAPLSVQELTKPSLPTSEQRKQALTGVRDIDLADSKIYAELFKGAGGNTPRSGIKNAEERRKELDKMRDEARARRNEEAKYMFDLQSQADKIAHFEQRLRVENSTVLHPNFLAAKFRDEWELDRRNRRTTPKEEGEA